MDAVFGWLALAGAFVCTGVFAIPMRLASVQQANLHPTIFQLYVGVSVLATSSPALAWPDFAWTWWGFVGGVLWACGNLCAVNAVTLCGLATAQGVWSTSACLTSFLWAFLGEPLWGNCECKLHNRTNTICGVALLLVGMLGIVRTSSPTNWSRHHHNRHRPHHPRSNPRLAEPLHAMGTSSGPSRPVADDIMASDRSRGVVVAIMSGALVGSVLVPSELTRSSMQGASFVFSFACGIASMSVACAVSTHLTNATTTNLRPHVRTVAVPCLLSGAVWSVGNVCLVVARSALGASLPHSLAFTSLGISSVVGVAVFKEVKGERYAAAFFVSCAVAIAGMVLLGVFGRCKS